MNAGWNHIAKSIFERPDVENISLEELDFLVEEYPYFPVIHFLRTRKLLADQVPPALSGVARTALYFPNPHWLNFQLEGIPAIEIQEPALSEVMTTPSGIEELESIVEEESIVPDAGIIQEETETVYDDKRVFNPAEPEKEERSAELASTNIDLIETELSQQPEVELQNEAEELEFDIIEPQESFVYDTESESQELAVDNLANEHPGETYEMKSEEKDEVTVVEVTTQSLEPELIDQDESMDNGERAPFELPSIEFPAEPTGETMEIPIEPLYTVDYFASQGIKLKLEEEPTDKLSIKLRSFTDWLKAMKKIHPEKLDHKMGQEEENSIRVYAETSNEPKELYTEALAEVYLQQGLRLKAVQVFEKLSLLDPSKSAYFAARIREIKEI